MLNKRVIKVKDVMRKESENYMEEFSGYHMLAYTVSQSFYNAGLGASVITPNIIFSLVDVKKATAKNKIKEALEDLIEWGLLETSQEVNKIGNNDMLIVSVPDMSGERFTTLNIDFCMKILTSDNRIDTKANLLSIYSLLAQYMGGKKFCFPSMDTMADELNLNRKTIANLLEDLEEMEIVFYDNNGIRQASNGMFTNSNNIYVMGDTPNSKDILTAELAKMKDK